MGDPVVIVAAVRTPLGGEGGPLSALTLAELGAVAVKAAVGRARLRSEQIGAVMLGSGPSAGPALGQAVAEAAGLSGAMEWVTEHSSPAPGVAAVLRALDRLTSAPQAIILAGGLDWPPGCDAGMAAGDEDLCAARERARQAIQAGAFTWEVVPVAVPGAALVGADRLPEPGQGAAPVAAVLALMRQSTAESMGLRPLAAVRGAVTRGPVPAPFAAVINELLGQTAWPAAGVDGWEVDDTAPGVLTGTCQALGLSPARVNVHGGPRVWGACGARMLVSLLGALRKAGGSRGVAVLSTGPGSATALALERVGGVACGGRPAPAQGCH